MLRGEPEGRTAIGGKTKHAAQPQRGRRLADWGASSQGKWATDWAERKSAPIHTLMIKNLRPQAGESVLDIGSGSGAYFETLRGEVGPSGRVIGIDWSLKMVERAQARIAEHGWENVEVRRADFTQTAAGPVTFDAATAIFALSAMPDVPSAVANAYAALRPGGRLFVTDLSLIPRGRAAPLIRLAGLVYRIFGGWSGTDVLDTVRARFDQVDLVVPPSVQSDKSWPPVTVFIATKAAAT